MSDYEKGIEAMGNTRLSHRLSPAELRQLADTFLAEQPAMLYCDEHKHEVASSSDEAIAYSMAQPTPCRIVSARIVVTP